MNSIVTTRFIACHKVLRKERIIRSSRQMALSLDYLPQSLSEILNGRRDVTIELLRKAVECYRLNPLYLFSGEGDMFLPPPEHSSAPPEHSASPETCILHVPAAWQSDYAVFGADRIPAPPMMKLPDERFRNGSYRSFEVAGDAMYPTLREGDKVVARFVRDDDWDDGIRQGGIHVVVTRHDVLIRRVDSRAGGQESFRLHADNDGQPVRMVPVSAIREIWAAEARFGTLSQDAIDSRPPVWRELAALRAAVNEQGSLLRQWQESLMEIR